MVLMNTYMQYPGSNRITAGSGWCIRSIYSNFHFPHRLPSNHLNVSHTERKFAELVSDVLPQKVLNYLVILIV